MSMSVDELKSQAAALSSAQRAELAHYLLTTLDSEDEGVELAWRAEIDRRVSEIRSGNAKGRSADEILAELRACKR